MSGLATAAPVVVRSLEAWRAVQGPRAWVVSELYWPEETSTGYILTHIAERLAGELPVGVLCGPPKYDRKGERLPGVQWRAGTVIVRCRGTHFDRTVLPLRLVNMLTITVSTFLHAVRAFRHGDVVLVVTNPPSLPFLTLLACRLRGARCLLIVHDVYPESLVAAGLAAPGGVVVRVLEALNRLLYRGVQAVTVLGRDMAVVAQRKIGDAPGAPVAEVIPNWAELETIGPGEVTPNPLLARLGLTGRFVVQYAGNMGHAHDLQSVVVAARAFRARDPEVHFLLIGSGAKRKWLEQVVAEEGLDNVTLLGPQPRGEQDSFLKACDVALIPFVRGMLGVAVPSRTYNIMAAGRPVLAMVHPDSEVAQVVREEAIGWTVPEGDPDGLIAAIQEAKADPAACRAKGRRARAVAESQYSFDAVFRAYGALVRRLLPPDRPSPLAGS